MRRRVSLVSAITFFAALTILGLFSPFTLSSAVAQQPTTIAISSPAPEVADLLQQGRRLEVERRWGEALTYYEDAIRHYPNDGSLQQRFDFARLHYDLGRRYADRSFLRAVAQSTPTAALDLYEQVLDKIQSHYVEIPNWRELVERGTNSLEAALDEAVFQQRQIPQADAASIAAFREELRRVMGSRSIHSRQSARETVALAAGLAQQRLNINPTAVVMEYVCGATNALDCYSAYLTPDQLTEVYSQIEGNFVGLGIELKAENGALVIVRVIPGSPAEQGGIRAGDRIVSVDGQSTAELTTDEAANLLQGQAGSTARLVVAAPGAQPRELAVTRRRVEVPSIDSAQILDPVQGIAYLRLACFQKTTSRDLDAALWKLHGQGMRRLIIDLRGNPGGLLVTAVEVVDKFVQRGIIVSTRGRSVQEDFTYSAQPAGTWRVPLVVLIDSDSASAAEIFAGAIRDHRRGTIVGERSYGKGSVQGIFPLGTSDAGIRLTTAKFYSPTGRAFSRVGVEPDVIVHLAAKPANGVIDLSAGSDQDPMLDAALHAARTQAQPRPVDTAVSSAARSRVAAPPRRLPAWSSN